ncbi:MAG: ribonuclease Z [Bacteroidaceae bacterium]|nr:ribonuclease Z [Bacteroidaceae bacterium]
MEKFEVTVLGCGSALPTVKHNGSGMVVNIREKYFLVDCAEGTQVELRRNHIHLNRLFNVFITHLHGDHCFGLMGLISTLGLLGRTAPLHVYGPQDIGTLFQPLIDYHCNGMTYEVVFHPIDTHQNVCIYEDKSLQVFSIPLKHRIRCCGYYFKEKELSRHILKEAIEKYDIPISQINNVKAGLDYVMPNGQIIKNEVLTTPPSPARSFAYCSDTVFRPEIAEMMKGVDLLYHEATFAESEKLLCSKVYHSTAKQAAEIAQLAGAKQLMLGHYSSRYNDETILQKEAAEVFENTILAKEGLVVTV